MLAIDAEGHGWRIDAGIGFKAPQFIQSFGIQCDEFAGRLAGKDQITSSAQHAAQHRILGFVFSHDFAGSHVDSRNTAADLLMLGGAATGKKLPWLVRFTRYRFLVGHCVTAFDDRDIPHIVLRVISGWRPVFATHITGAGDAYRVAATRRCAGHIRLYFFLGIVVQRTTGFRVQTTRPGQSLNERGTPDKLAAGPVQRIAEAVTVGVQCDLAWLTVNFGVNQNMLADGVIVIGVVRGILKMPFDRAGIGIQGDGTVGIQVVARTVFRIPVRAGVANTPDDQILIRIIRAGNPGRAAAVFPGIVQILPGFVTRLTRTGNGEPAPAFFLGIEIGRCQPAANPVFSATDTGNCHVFDNQRSTGNGFPNRRIG